MRIICNSASNFDREYTRAVIQIKTKIKGEQDGGRI